MVARLITQKIREGDVKLIYVSLILSFRARHFDTNTFYWLFGFPRLFNVHQMHLKNISLDFC